SNKHATSPIRICHNDTKLSNLLFHTENDTALCLVDLDTLMPGYFYFDFGDLSRTVLDPKDEESREPLREKLDLSLLRALLNGVESSGVHLTKTEKDSLAYGMVLMPFLHGIRGLTDYLLGDPYYQVRYPDQNLIRAHNLISYARLVQKGFLPVQEMIKSELGAT
ncbi:MAG: phosphotransferase, partial [Eudoraea sp.]|nr:phosphotransferase [Eudoraea sp.]